MNLISGQPLQIWTQNQVVNLPLQSTERRRGRHLLFFAGQGVTLKYKNAIGLLSSSVDDGPSASQK